MEKLGLVNKIIKFSSVDGIGNRSAIFLQGCNFNCTYCHNPETINNCKNCSICLNKCPVNALLEKEKKIIWDNLKCINCDNCIKGCPHFSSPKTRLMSSTEVFEEIGSTIKFIRGITVSGGECTIQNEFITELFKLAKQKNLTTFIDSNGYYDFSNDNNLLSVTDSVMLDVKAFNNEEHLKITGKPNDIVLKNISFLGEIGKLFEVRTVAVPLLFNVEETVRKVSQIISKYKITRYKIIKYRSIGVREEFINYETPSDEFIKKLKKIAIENGVCEVVTI